MSNRKLLLKEELKKQREKQLARHSYNILLEEQKKEQEALWSAASIGDETKVHDLIDARVNVNYKNLMEEASGYTALGIAAHLGHMKVMRMLLDANADTEICSTSKDWTLLHWACLTNKFDIVKLLVDHNANMNARDCSGRTPLHYSVRKGRTDTRVLELLIQHGANVIARSDRGITVLDEALQNGCSDHVHIIEEKRNEAFAMGLHPRLGAGTNVSKIEDEILNIILRMTRS
jgi:ankyrin repeat protein